MRRCLTTLLTMTLACGVRAQSQGDAVSSATAMITRNEARFIFPREGMTITLPPNSGKHAADSPSTLPWRVNWIPPETRHGIDPDGLWIGKPWSDLPDQTMALADVLRRTPVRITTFCLPCTSLQRESPAMNAACLPTMPDTGTLQPRRPVVGIQEYVRPVAVQQNSIPPDVMHETLFAWKNQ